jgi:hypothetical protein
MLATIVAVEKQSVVHIVCVCVCVWCMYVWCVCVWCGVYVCVVCVCVCVVYVCVVCVCVCVHNRRYSACNAHAPYFHLLPVRMYIVFSHYLIERHDFRK